jgi:hypothetical protein
MKNRINFNVNCNVSIIFKTKDSSNPLVISYVRPKSISDINLTKEALSTIEDMKEKKLQNFKEVLAIFIARNQVQFSLIAQEPLYNF